MCDTTWHLLPNWGLGNKPQGVVFAPMREIETNIQYSSRIYPKGDFTETQLKPQRPERIESRALHSTLARWHNTGAVTRRQISPEAGELMLVPIVCRQVHEANVITEEGSSWAAARQVCTVWQTDRKRKSVIGTLHQKTENAGGDKAKCLHTC